MSDDDFDSDTPTIVEICLDDTTPEHPSNGEAIRAERLWINGVIDSMDALRTQLIVDGYSEETANLYVERVVRRIKGYR